MTTATGDYVVNFATYGAQNPYVNTGWTKIVNTSYDWQVASNVLKAPTADSVRRWIEYNAGTPDGTGIMETRVEIGTYNEGDHLEFGVLDSVGNGYFTTLNYGSTIGYCTAYSGWASIGTGASITGGVNAGDVFTFRIEPGTGSTHTVTVLKNGSQVHQHINRSDAGTFTGNMRPFIGVRPLNSNGSAYGSFGVEGLGAATVKKLKLKAHSSAASATNIKGVVFQSSAGIAGAKIGEFTGKTFEATLDAGDAVLKVPVADFNGTSLTTSDTPVALVTDGTYTTGIISCTVIEE